MTLVEQETDSDKKVPRIIYCAENQVSYCALISMVISREDVVLQEFSSKSCNSMVPEPSEQQMIERPPSRVSKWIPAALSFYLVLCAIQEFVDALLQVSKHQFIENEKSWVDEFLSDKEVGWQWLPKGLGGDYALFCRKMGMVGKINGSSQKRDSRNCQQQK